MRRGPALPNPARLHRLSTVSFWRAPSRNGYGAPCAFTVDWRRSTILWLPAMSWSQGMFFADSSTNAAYWAQRQRELGADEVMGPRERPKEGTTPAVKRPASVAGSHPQPRLFGAGLPSRARDQATPTSLGPKGFCALDGRADLRTTVALRRARDTTSTGSGVPSVTSNHEDEPQRRALTVNRPGNLQAGWRWGDRGIT